MSPTTTFVTLLRREFWEHRALWAAPLVVALMLVAVTILGGGMVRGPVVIDINGQQTDFIAAMHRVTKLPLDIHLMVEHPLPIMEAMDIRPGDRISLHVELGEQLHELA